MVCSAASAGEEFSFNFADVKSCVVVNKVQHFVKLLVCENFIVRYKCYANYRHSFVVLPVYLCG